MKCYCDNETYFIFKKIILHSFNLLYSFEPLFFVNITASQIYNLYKKILISICLSKAANWENLFYFTGSVSNVFRKAWVCLLTSRKCVLYPAKYKVLLSTQNK